MAGVLPRALREEDTGWAGGAVLLKKSASSEQSPVCPGAAITGAPNRSLGVDYHGWGGMTVEK